MHSYNVVHEPVNSSSTLGRNRRRTYRPIIYNNKNGKNQMRRMSTTNVKVISENVTTFIILDAFRLFSFLTLQDIFIHALQMEVNARSHKQLKNKMISYCTQSWRWLNIVCDDIHQCWFEIWFVNSILDSKRKHTSTFSNVTNKINNALSAHILLVGLYALKDRNRDADVSSADVSQSTTLRQVERSWQAYSRFRKVPCKVGLHAVRHFAVGSVSCHTCTAVNDIRPSWQWHIATAWNGSQ